MGGMALVSMKGRTSFTLSNRSFIISSLAIRVLHCLEVIKEAVTTHNWIICDGDIDPEWVEVKSAVW
eukprot:2696585-Amphidinium_carterae.1